MRQWLDSYACQKGFSVMCPSKTEKSSNLTNDSEYQSPHHPSSPPSQTDNLPTQMSTRPTKEASGITVRPSSSWPMMPHQVKTENHDENRQNEAEKQLNDLVHEGTLLPFIISYTKIKSMIETCKSKGFVISCG